MQCQFEHHKSHNYSIGLLVTNGFFILQRGFWYNFFKFCVRLCVYTHTNVKLFDSVMLFA